MTKKAFPALIFLAGAAWTLIAYWPHLNGGFLFDDYPNIVSNGMVKLNALNADDLYQVWSSGISSPLGRPIAMLSFGLNHYFLGADAYGYKLVNLIIHLLVGLSLYWLTTLLARATRFTYGIRMAAWFPPTVAALWLIHPFNLTSVLYIVQRMTSLAALFMVLGLALYALGRLRMLAGRRGHIPIAASLLICMPLSIGGKEIGVLLPWMIAAMEWFVFRFGTGGGVPIHWVAILNRLLLFGPFLAALALLTLRPDFMLGSYEMREFTMVERLWSQTRIVWFYLGQTIVPDISAMGLFHDTFDKSTGWMEPITTLLSTLGLMVLLITGLAIRNSAPLVGLGIMLFLIGHSLEAGPLALEMIHEHRNYFPSAGVMLALIAGLSQSSESVKLRKFVPVMTLILAALFGSALYLRAQSWGSPLQLLTTLVTYHPDSGRARYELGRAYALLYSANKTRPEELFIEARKTLEKSHQLDQTNVAPTIAIVLLHWFAEREPPRHLKERIGDILAQYSHIPVSVSATGTLVNCRKKPNCPISTSEMLGYFLRALSNDRLPDVIKAQWLAQYSRFLIADLKAVDDGLRMQAEAVKLSPKDPRHKFNQIQFLALTGRITEALHYLREYEQTGQLDSFKSSIKFLSKFAESIENESLTPEEIEARWKTYSRRTARAKRSEKPGDALTPSFTSSPNSTNLGG